MLFRTIIAGTALSWCVACTSKVTTRTAVSDKKESRTGTPTTSAGEAQTFEITGRTPALVGPGGEVTLVGTGFSQDMTLVADGTTLSMSVDSDSQARFVAPASGATGPIQLTAQLGATSQTISIFFDGGKTDYPIWSGNASAICRGTLYYDEDGTLLEGTKSCDTDDASSDSDEEDGPSQIYQDCATDGEVGCITTSNFKAARVDNFSSNDIRSGVTVAGVAGSLSGAPSSCSSDGEVGCLASATFPAVDKAAKLTAQASKIRSSLTIAGVAGSLSDCGADGDGACYVDGSAFKALSPTSVDASKMLSTLTLLGVQGTLTSRGSWDLTTTFPGAGYYTGVTQTPTQGAIKAGAQILGITGNYPSASSPLVGADGTTDLSSLAASTSAGTYEWFESDGTRRTGTISDAGTVTPSTSDQSFTTSVYRQFTVAGDADLVAAKIKSGVSLFGVSGDYPSSSNPLAGADGTADLDSATFDAKIKSATNFEWFDASGTRYARGGDADITAGNIADGITVFGTTGTLAGGANCSSDGQSNCFVPTYNGTTNLYKAGLTTNVSTWDIRLGKQLAGVSGSLEFYKNMVGSFNRTSGTGAHASQDIYDTIDDHNNTGSFASTVPTVTDGGATVTGWTQATGQSWIRDSQSDTGVGAEPAAMDSATVPRVVSSRIKSPESIGPRTTDRPGLGRMPSHIAQV